MGRAGGASSKTGQASPRRNEGPATEKERRPSPPHHRRYYSPTFPRIWLSLVAQSRNHRPHPVTLPFTYRPVLPPPSLVSTHPNLVCFTPFLAFLAHRRSCFLPSPRPEHSVPHCPQAKHIILPNSARLNFSSFSILHSNFHIHIKFHRKDLPTVQEIFLPSNY